MTDIARTNSSEEKIYLKKKHADVSEKLALAYFCLAQELENEQDLDTASDLYTLALTTLDNIGLVEGKLVQRIAKCKALLIDKKATAIDSRKTTVFKKISDSGLHFVDNEASLRSTKKKNTQFTIRGGSTGAAMKNQRPLSSVGTGTALLTSQQRPGLQSATDDIDRAGLFDEKASHQAEQLRAAEGRSSRRSPSDQGTRQPFR